MITTTLASLGIFVLTQFTKKFITPKFGDTGLHVFIFAVAGAVFALQGLATTYPSFHEILLKAGAYLLGSIALYELIVKQVKDLMA